MIAEDESLFVVMDTLNQVRRRRRMEKLLSNSHDVTGRVVARFSNTEKFGSSLHFCNDDAIVFGYTFSSHSSHLRFHDDSSI